jgi:hypothetical protein
MACKSTLQFFFEWTEGFEKRLRLRSSMIGAILLQGGSGQPERDKGKRKDMPTLGFPRNEIL